MSDEPVAAEPSALERYKLLRTQLKTIQNTKEPGSAEEKRLLVELEKLYFTLADDDREAL